LGVPGLVLGNDPDDPTPPSPERVDSTDGVIDPQADRSPLAQFELELC
jgi:hypothetical protein